MPNIGPLEIGIVLLIALLVLGPKKLPDFGRSLGSGLREFKDGITDREGAERESPVDTPGSQRSTVASNRQLKEHG